MTQIRQVVLLDPQPPTYHNSLVWIEAPAPYGRWAVPAVALQPVKVAAPGRPLTLATLRAKRASHDMIETFRGLFGRSVEVTEEVCLAHARRLLDFEEAAVLLLSAKALAAYHDEARTARRLLALATGEADAVYSARIKTIEAAYSPCTGWDYHTEVKPALVALNAATDLAWDERQIALLPAARALAQVLAAAFAKAYIGDTP